MLWDYWPDYPPDWKLRRYKIAERADYKCEECKRYTNLKQGHAHHVISILNGGTNKLENLKWLCFKCHGLQHKKTYGKYLKHRYPNADGLSPQSIDNGISGEDFDFCCDDIHPAITNKNKRNIINFSYPLVNYHKE